MEGTGHQGRPVEEAESSQAGEPPEPLNVALLVDEDYLQRFGSVFGHMLIGLVDEAVGLTIICPDPRLLSELPTGPAKVIVHRPPLWPWSCRKQRRQLADRLDGAKIDLIHSCCGAQADLARELAGHLDRPYVVSVTGLLQRECFWRIDKTRCRALIAISEPIRQMLTDTHRSMADRVHLIRPGCFRHPPRQAHDTTGVKTIVSAGCLDRRGGYDLLLRALGRVAKRDIDFLMFLFGTGPVEHLLRRWVRTAKLEAHVTFLHPIANWQRVLDDANFYIQPGVFYQLHSGPYEALARGCPIVATPETAFDLMVDGEVGRFFPNGDEDALVDILTEWLTHPDTLGAMSARTSEFAPEMISLHQAVGKLTAVYRAALNHARR